MIKNPSAIEMQGPMNIRETSSPSKEEPGEKIPRPSLIDSPLGKRAERDQFNHPEPDVPHKRPSLRDSPLARLPQNETMPVESNRQESARIDVQGAEGDQFNHPEPDEPHRRPSLRDSPLAQLPQNETMPVESNRQESAQTDVRDKEQTEIETRELTQEEKDFLKKTLGWTDAQIAKCTIDKDGVIHYKTDNCHLEGKTTENGVPYERKRVVINGVIIEGVFPVFDSKFDTYLPKELEQSSNYANYCNERLKEKALEDPELASQFTPEQLEAIMAGKTPKGYVWHHNEEQGKMQLVKVEDHDRTRGGAAHTGGNALWGNKTDGSGTASA